MKVYSHSLLGKRETNEDQHINILNLLGENPNYNNINFFGVFDGHGGKAVSKYLKDNLPKFFIDKFPDDNEIYSNSNHSIKYFNKVYDYIQNTMIQDHPKFVQYCGSTACVGIHYKKDNKDRLWILNVGDSRAVKCSKTNIADALTHDHKPNRPDEKKRIEDLGGSVAFDGFDWRIKNLSLSRAFGDLDCSPYVINTPQIYKYKINSNDNFIIFACDGLWDVLTNQDAVDFINELTLKKFKGNYAKELAELALNKGSLDNITVMVYMLK